MLERIKAAVDAVTRERCARKLLRQHMDVWNPSNYTWTVMTSDWPVWNVVSADGTMVVDTWRRTIDYTAETMTPVTILGNGEFYDTGTYNYDWRTHSIDMPVW